MSITLADFNNLLLTIGENIKSTQEERKKLQEKLISIDEELSYMKGAYNHLNKVGPKGLKYGENTFTYAMKQGKIVLKDQEKEEMGDIIVDRK